MDKIGIGVTSYKRPEHLELFMHQNWKYTHAGVKAKMSLETGIITHKDNDNEYYFVRVEDIPNIAQAKNECLKALKDCDYIFLFDDDCFPIKQGWVEYFINAHKASEQHHFLYLKETSTIKKISTSTNQYKTPPIYEYNNCGGCFMFLTKEVIQKVGGFNKTYKQYGFEHAGYSERIHKAGLTPMGKYLCPAGAGEYIYSLDYDNYLDFKIDHKPSLTVKEVSASLDFNRQNYFKDIENIYQEI